MPDRVRVIIQMGELKAEAEGHPEDVLRFVSGFVQQHLPAYGLARRLAAAPDVSDLLEALRDYLGYSDSEGVFLRPAARLLPDSQMILLYLAKTRIEHLLGLSERGSVSTPKLGEELGLKARSLTARLAELVRGGLALRVERGEYQVTTSGILALLEKIKVPRPEA